MNNFLRKIVLVVGCSLVFFSTQAQNTHAVLSDMVTAIKGNKVQDMEKYIDNFVTVSINNNQAVYSHNQAMVVLHDFFEKNDAKDFHIMDSGSPNSSSAFVIGTYSTPAGNKYTVYVLMRLKESKYMLQEVRVNKD